MYAVLTRTEESPPHMSRLRVLSDDDTYLIISVYNSSVRMILIIVTSGYSSVIYLC